MDHSQHVCVGRRGVAKLRRRPSAVTRDQPNWRLHSPGHRKNGKRDVKKVPNLKSNSPFKYTEPVRYEFCAYIYI